MAWLCAHGVSQSLEDSERAFRLDIRALTLGPGMRKAIIGPNGSGKTTAMDLLALASRPRAAESFLLIDENRAPHDLAGFGRHGRDRAAWIRAHYFGYVLQTGHLLPFLTIGENILLAQKLAGRTDRTFAREILSELGVAASFSTMPSDLSVGQRQRVAVARALAHRPRFLFADEPTAALDPEAAPRTLGICLDIAMQQNSSVLIITHDHKLARDLDFEIVEIVTRVEGGTVISTLDDGTQPPGEEEA